MEQPLGCCSLGHQVSSEREVGPLAETYTEVLGFEHAAGSLRAIQENSVTCTQKPEIQDSKCSRKAMEEAGFAFANNSKRSGIKVLEKILELAQLYFKELVALRQGSLVCGRIQGLTETLAKVRRSAW